MKRIILILVLVMSIIFITNAKNENINTPAKIKVELRNTKVNYSQIGNLINTSIDFSNIINSNSEVIIIDCYELAQGYYEYLVNEEGYSPRDAGVKARALRDACEEAQ